MKYLSKITALLLGCGAFTSQEVQSQVVVYDNSDIKLLSGYTSTLEFGDEVILGGTQRELTALTFSYLATGLNGGEQVTLRIYNNTGAPWPGDPARQAPGPLPLYTETVALPVTTAEGATLRFDLSPQPIVLDNMTWTVQFTGVDAGETVGLNIYNPPDIGANPDSYWENTLGVWELRVINGGATPANFGAVIEAVPEPGTIVLGLLGGLSLLALRRRKA